MICSGLNDFFKILAQSGWNSNLCFIMSATSHSLSLEYHSDISESTILQQCVRKHAGFGSAMASAAAGLGRRFSLDILIPLTHTSQDILFWQPMPWPMYGRQIYWLDRVLFQVDLTVMTMTKFHLKMYSQSNDSLNCKTHMLPLHYCNHKLHDVQIYWWSIPGEKQKVICEDSNL